MLYAYPVLHLIVCIRRNSAILNGSRFQAVAECVTAFLSRSLELKEYFACEGI